jgi:hypothetical protein
MVPPQYVTFFATSMGSAAALLGLLFVAVSIAPERTVAQDAPIERQVVADSAFTALVNAFFLSMAGAIPGLNIGIVATTLGSASLVQTVSAGKRLWTVKTTVRSPSRRIALVVVGLVVYAFQLYYGQQLLRSPADVAAFTGLINPLFGIYGFALARSWELLGARRGILRAALTSKVEAKTDEVSPVQPAR